MKKGFNKFILSLLLLFVFVINVKAGVTPKNCLELKETSPGKPSHFDTRVVQCKWQFLGRYEGIGPSIGKSYPTDYQAQRAAEEEITVWTAGIEVANSSKGDTVTVGGGDQVKVKRCTHKDAYIETTARCTAVYHASECVNHPGKSDTYLTTCCTNKKSKYPCSCNDGYPAYAECTCNGETKRKPYGTKAEDVSCNDSWNLKTPYKDYFLDPSKGTKKYGYTEAKADCEKDHKGEKGFEKCLNCNPKSLLKCPVFDCVPEEKLIGGCAPEFEYDGEEVYCVNPGLAFSNVSASDGYGKTDEQGYAIDSSFDYRKCNTSYQSEECGYANILIESDWLKKKGGVSANLLDYQTVNLAMRIYGAYVSSRGYIELSGLGIYSTDAGTNNMDGNRCPHDSLFLFTPSVYTRTKYKIIELKKAFFEYVSSKYDGNYINAADFEKDFAGTDRFDIDGNMGCEAGQIGYICKASGRDFRNVRLAIGLFFNTIMGNNKMQDHIDELYGVTIQTVKGAELVSTTVESTKTSGSDDWSLIETDFGDINYELEVGKKYDCDKLKEYDPELAERIRPYCQIEMRYYNSKGEDITNIAMDYCTGKHVLRCVSKPINIATCDENRRWQNVTYTYAKEKSTTTTIITEEEKHGPVRMISCDSPDSSQFMYGIVSDIDYKLYGDDSSGRTETTTTTTERDTKGRTETVRLFSRECESAVKCIHTELRSNPAKCDIPKSKEESDERENGVVTGYVKDPSLKCILNASAEAKSRYDYSDVFGVNTNLCRVYCSDEVEYYIPDKTTIKGGLGIKYDIGIKSYLNRTDDRLISNAIKEKRTCVSEIDYHRLKDMRWEVIFGFSLKVQKDALGTLSDGSAKPIYNWSDLYKVLKKVKGSKSNKSNEEGASIEENINEIIFDLYNCNFFDEKVFKDNKVHRPRQRAFGTNTADSNTYKDFIKKEYSASNSRAYYGLQGGINKDNEQCSYDKTSGKLSCMSMDSIYYAGGSETTNGKNVGENPGDGTTKIVLDNISSGSLTTISYCKDTKDNKCFDYTDSSAKPNSAYDLSTYNYTRNNSSNTTKDGKLIPENDYAIFSVTTEVGFYNDTSFQTEPSTGKVSIIENADKTPNDGRLKVPQYSYPTSKFAYSSCAKSGNSFFSSGTGIYKTKEFNNCKVDHKYSQINTYYRIQYNDNFAQVIKGVVPQCYYDVTGAPPFCPPGTTICPGGPADIGEYRNVNRENLFPVENLSEAKTNWDTETGVEVKEKIENAGSNIYADDEYLQYSFELNPTQLRNIKQYNKSAPSYVDIPIDNCELTDKINENGTYLNCRIVNGGLLYEIRASQSDYSNTSYATIINNHDGSDLYFNKDN